MTPADPAASVLDPTAAPPAPPVDLLAEPTFEECHAECIRYAEDREAGRINMNNIPGGHHIAYYGGRIHDHDEDQTALRARVAATLGVHPARIVIFYPWMW